MRVDELMTKNVECCRSEDPISRAAQIMWDRDCGIVPVVDDDGRVIALLTDRDICMATYTKNRAPSDIRVGEVASSTVYSVAPDDTLDIAERVMAEQQVHRLPVVDNRGRIAGVLSINDLASHAGAAMRTDGLSHHSVVELLAAIGAPRPQAAERGGRTA